MKRIKLCLSSLPIFIVLLFIFAIFSAPTIYAATNATIIDAKHIRIDENNKIYTLDKATGNYYWLDDTAQCKEYISLSLGQDSGTLYHNGGNGKCSYDKRELSFTDNRPTAPPPCAKDAYINGICTSFDTGLGPISTDAGGFIGKIFAVLLAASGAIALLLIIRAGYKIMTSQGNPEAVKEGREQLIAAIVGLLFLIFSFVLLELIGVDILKIPGIGGTNVPLNCKVGKPC